MDGAKCVTVPSAMSFSLGGLGKGRPCVLPLYWQNFKIY